MNPTEQNQMIQAQEQRNKLAYQNKMQMNQNKNSKMFQDRVFEALATVLKEVQSLRQDITDNKPKKRK